MKKIISALTVSALVAGAAFADVSVTCNYRQRATLLSHTAEYGANDAQSTIFYADQYNGSGTDNLSITLEGDIVSFQTVIVGDQNTTNGLRAKTLGADLKLGKVQMFAGVYSDGKVKGAYRNKTDIDAGNMEGVDFEFEKLGSRFKGSPSWFVDNMALGVATGSDEPWVIGAKYAIPGLKKVKVEVNGSYITNTRRAGNSLVESSGNLQGHTFAGLIETRTARSTVEYIFKVGQYNNDANAIAVGCYAQPSLFDNLTVTLGGASSAIKGNWTDWSADLRLYYKMGDLSFSSFHNYSALVDADDAKAYIKNGSNKGIADSGAGAGKHSGTGIKSDAIMANNLMVRYKVNSKVAVYGVVASFMGMSDEFLGAKVAQAEVKELRASLWGQFYAGSSSISIGCVFEDYDYTEEIGDAVKNIAIPMIFRVKM